MLRGGSWLYACDNSGAIKLKLLHMFKNKFSNSVGSRLLIIVKTTYSATKRKVRVKLDSRYKALLVRDKFPKISKTGYKIRFRNFAAIIYAAGPSYAKANVFNPIAKRIYGPVEHKLRYQGFSRITSMAKRLI